MRKKRENPSVTRKKSSAFSPFDYLVGYSGKVSFRKLKPLKRSRSDKIREKTVEQDFLEKCNGLAHWLTCHRQLLELLSELTCCNGEKSCESVLCQELQERRTTNTTVIKFYLEQLGFTEDGLPQQIKASLDEIMCKDKKLRAILEKSSWSIKKGGKSKGNATKVDPGGHVLREETKSNEQYFQVFIHGVKPGHPLVLMIKQEELGRALREAVLAKCPTLPSSFVLLHQGRKIHTEHTLKEQGLAQDCNIHAHFRLCGGMEKEGNTSVWEAGEKRTKSPQNWKKTDVIRWIDEVCDKYEIDNFDVSELKTLSGAGLMKLNHEDWIRRSPKQGDLFYNLWNELLQTASSETGKGTTKSPPVSPRKGSAKKEPEKFSQNEQGGEGKTGLKQRNVSRDGSELHPSPEKPISFYSQVSASSYLSDQGPFGSVEKLNSTGDYITIDELSRQRPPDNRLVAVTGLCSCRPHNAGGAGRFRLRNDPNEGQEFLELKIDIRACPGSNVLTKNVIKAVLQMKVGEQLFVRGKIKHLDEVPKSMKKGFRILPFAVIVDDDYHAAFREDRKVEKSYERQISIPWTAELGLYPAEASTQEPLYLNDSLETTYGILFFPSDSSHEKIKESVVALKNSATGDIFVGVNDDGMVIGSRVPREGIIQKRDELVRVMSGVLPCTNESVSFCTSAEQAQEFVEKEKDFVAAMWLQSETPSSTENLEANKDISVIFRLHVVKGQSVIHFAKPEDTHAFIRVGTDTKLVSDYGDLFSRLESLASRNIPEKTPTSINREVDKASSFEPSEKSYPLRKRVNFETDQVEFKVIYGDPLKIILKDYVKKYSASFMNSDGGDILFGVEEEKKTKIGFVVGISLSSSDRRELLQESSKMICNFWPPVDSGQFFMKFFDVTWDSSKNLLKYPKTYVEKAGNYVAVHLVNTSDAQKLVNWGRAVDVRHFCVFRLKSNRFGLFVKDATKLNIEDFLSKMENESNKTRYFSMEAVSSEEVETCLRNLCVVHLHVRASPYPIHLTSPFHTHCLDSQGLVCEIKPNQLLERFAKRDFKYEPEKLLNLANRFEKQNTSYVLVCSPFSLPKTDRDLYGLVVPEWALVLDFDQAPHQEGHLLNVFKPLHDRHQVERNLFVETPLDRRLDLNPRNGVCWCAVRGYEDIDKTLSKEGHASWMKSHGHKLRALIDQLVVHINPNRLVVICLWDDGHEKLLPSLDMLLQHLFSSWGPTKPIFVCSSSSAKSAILTSIVDPLEKADFPVRRDNIFVARPHEMARHIGAELPPPYRSEDAFQIPRKYYAPELGERTIPDTLPQPIRQAIQGHLQIMYQHTGGSLQLKPDDEDALRVKFYSGSEIDETGLASEIAIERCKMKELKKEMKLLLNDKRSHVSLIIVKAERGAGATTLCLQLLYEFHKQFVCARVLEFHDSLGTNIEKINQHSRLPMILFVDSEMAYVPEFNDFKNDSERRNLNLKLLVVESDLSYSQQRKQPKQYSVGTIACRTVELSRELTKEEASQLVDQYLKIKGISEEKRNKLKGLKGRVSKETSLRKFAIVSLTVFGRQFAGLPNFVAYRLDQANDLQLQILEFLALIHVYTDFLFPVNALARLANREVVLLETIFNNDDVRELLSPPSTAGRNVRRLSFVEVAEEVLEQRAKKLEEIFTSYLKDVAIRLARCALSDPRPSKRIDRITRRLYVTSEYGSEKFSPLVRSMKESDRDVARDMLSELGEVFEKGSDVWAHLLAHLAKYYMTVYDQDHFEHAIPLIEEAVREKKDDVLLHHIHGDVIRLHVQNLKDKQVFSLDEVLRYAIQCSQCFEMVKEKRPLMEHGYSSDALIRKVVMFAAIKSVGGSSFVDFLKIFVSQREKNETLSSFRQEDKYVLALVPESFENLRVVPINEYNAKLKDNLLESLGDLNELKTIVEHLKEIMKDTNDEAWMDVVALQTMSLVYSLEIERKQLGPEEADEKIERLEELLRKSNYEDGSMKIWIRCVRFGSKVPSLKAVRSKMDGWLKATGRKSPNALFYNYVIAILEALSDPNDTEKMKKANDCVREMQRKRKLPKSRGVSQDPSLPVEWLHPKEGRHIDSLGSLLYHEDLVRDYLKKATLQHQERAGKEIIDKALFQKNITRWEGVVSEKISDWKGIISLKKHISVSFVPINVQPFIPNQGEEVSFCLAFHWTGPYAWYVICGPGAAKAKKAGARSSVALPIDPSHHDSDSEGSDKSDDEDLLPLVGQALHTKTVTKGVTVSAENHEGFDWRRYLDQEMQGIIFKRFPDAGHGRIYHPEFKDCLFFHAKQIVPPVDSLNAIELYSVVSFTVGKTEKGPRAMNIETVEEKDISPDLKKCLEDLRKGEPALSSARGMEEDAPRMAARPDTLPKTLEDLYTMNSRQEGHICQLRGPPLHNSVSGFIKVPSLDKELFFSEFLSGIPKREIANIHLNARVQFSVDKNEKGFFAKKLYIKFLQPPDHESKQVKCRCGWEDSFNKGIQEGFVGKILPQKHCGFITRDYPTERNPTGIYFNESELRGTSITHLNVGDRVHFVVGQNDEGGCVARKVDVQGQNQFAPQRAYFRPSTTHDPRLFSDIFSGAQPNLGRYGPLARSPTLPPQGYSLGAPPPHPPIQDEGNWQTYRRKR